MERPVDRIATSDDPPCVVAEIANTLNAYIAERQPRYQYWETRDGRMFVYTTERFRDGKFGSAIYAPTGKGARSGKRHVEEWKVTREVHHSTRKAAKTRAYRLFTEWQS